MFLQPFTHSFVKVFWCSIPWHDDCWIQLIIGLFLHFQARSIALRVQGGKTGFFGPCWREWAAVWGDQEVLEVFTRVWKLSYVYCCFYGSKDTCWLVTKAFERCCGRETVLWRGERWIKKKLNYILEKYIRVLYCNTLCLAMHNCMCFLCAFCMC